MDRVLDKKRDTGEITKLVEDIKWVIIAYQVCPKYRQG